MMVAPVTAAPVTAAPMSGSMLSDQIPTSNKRPMLPRASSLPKANSNLFKATASTRKTSSELRRMEDAIIPGTMLSENPLSPIPATPVPSSSSSEIQPIQQNQRGGDPFSAFLLAAAQQAVPAAALLGAYAVLPAKRSSGLGPPHRNRKTRRFRKARL
jgi:hypothetical protein